MVHLSVRHRVEDFDKWNQVFNETLDLREGGGEKNVQIFRKLDDPNDLELIFEWDNIEKAQQFLCSDTLKERMKDAGVIEQPEIYMLERFEENQCR